MIYKRIFVKYFQNSDNMCYNYIVIKINERGEK